LAGVAKRIKLYDFRAVLANPTAYHYPMTQIQCAAKISNVSWNPYCKNMLSNSDYDGTVQIWDVSAQRSIKRYQCLCGDRNTKSDVGQYSSIMLIPI
uniref:WD_REPEATS_REGION domain-containing protein n=1 Tax=Gongylonema pulchrum TaxID=637853 RepID=A0A183DSM3_9BILA